MEIQATGPLEEQIELMNSAWPAITQEVIAGNRVYLLDEPSNDNITWKIGYVENPGRLKRRISELNCGRSTDLVLRGILPGGPTLERTLHSLLAEFNKRREFFSLPRRLRKQLLLLSEQPLIDLDPHPLLAGAVAACYPNLLLLIAREFLDGTLSVRLNHLDNPNLIARNPRDCFVLHMDALNRACGCSYCRRRCIKTFKSGRRKWGDDLIPFLFTATHDDCTGYQRLRRAS